MTTTGRISKAHRDLSNFLASKDGGALAPKQRAILKKLLNHLAIADNDLHFVARERSGCEPFSARHDKFVFAGFYRALTKDLF